MPKVKYMGASHVHELLEGDDFGGQLATPLKETVTFDRSNNWVVDAKEAGLSNEACEILLASGDFADVTKGERVPLNEHQKLFLAMKDGTEEEAPGGTVVATGVASSDDSDSEARKK